MLQHEYLSRAYGLAKSIDLVVLVYHFTVNSPQEQYGLTSQMRRAAVSFSNIAEGSRRRGKDIRQFLIVAFASGSELETQFEVSKRLEFGDRFFGLRPRDYSMRLCEC